MSALLTLAVYVIGGAVAPCLFGLLLFTGIRFRLDITA